MGGAALPIASAGIGALGNLFGPKTNVAVPGDLAGARGSQLNLLQNLLQGSPGNALSGVQNAFPNLGIPQTDLQRQSAGGISQFLSQDSPYMQTINKAFPALQAIMSPTNNPIFEQALSLANQQGGRFSSGNDILRGQAVTGMFGLANQAAGTAGMLGNELAGQFGQGFGIGTQQAQQGDVGLQRALQLWGGLLGLRQQATMGLPITQTPNALQSIGGAGLGLAGLLPFLGGGGGLDQFQGYNPYGGFDPTMIPTPTVS